MVESIVRVTRFALFTNVNFYMFLKEQRGKLQSFIRVQSNKN